MSRPALAASLPSPDRGWREHHAAGSLPGCPTGVAVDATKRAAIYKEIQEIMLKQALVVPMWYGLNTYVGRANARDVIIEPFAYPMLYDAWLAPA